MMKIDVKLLIFLVLPLPHAAFAELAEKPDIYEMRFTQFNCGRDWPDNTALEAVILFREEIGRQIYQVRNPLACGMKVRNPRYAIVGDSLKLGYETYADGPLAACFCEHKSEFSFRGLPAENLNAMFDSSEKAEVELFK